MDLEVEYVVSESNNANLLTKPLEKERYHNHRQSNGNPLWDGEIKDKGSVDISEIQLTEEEKNQTSLAFSVQAASLPQKSD